MTVSGGRICSYGDGTAQEPPAPDCGTKHSKWYAELNYSSRKRDFLMLEQAPVLPLGPLLRCPSGSGAWPALLEATSGDHWHQTTIQYTIKLTRVGKVRT
jgi:hypothetical protein